MNTRTVLAAGAATGVLLAGGPVAVAGALVHRPRLAPCASCHGNDGTRVVTQARRYLDTPYEWGGESRSGMDCSGFVQRVFADLGTRLPRTAAEQQHAGRPVPSLAAARPGDLLFWDYGNGDHHVAIYEGNGRLIEAPQPGMTVSERRVYDGVIAIRRVNLNGTGQ